VTPREVQMKRAAQFLIVALIVVSFASNSLAKDEENLFDGFWKTRRGSIVKIDGDQGIFVYTPVESWKGHIDKVIIRNIHQEENKWIADEYIAPNGKGFWAGIEWELNNNRIIRRVLFEGKTVESYYERVAAVSDNPGIHSDNPGIHSDNPGIHSDNPGTHSSASSPKSMAGRFGLGARIAYVNYDEEPNDAAMYGVNLTYFFHRYASFELSVDYTDADVVGLSGDAGALEQVPVLLTLRMHFSTNPRVSPYVGGGVGYYFNDFDSDSGSPNIDVDNNFGVHVNGGLEVFITDNAAINLDIKYVWQELDVDNKPPGLDEEFKRNQFVAGVGFKVYF
jgi:outer membrane protein